MLFFFFQSDTKCLHAIIFLTIQLFRRRRHRHHHHHHHYHHVVTFRVQTGVTCRRRRWTQNGQVLRRTHEVLSVEGDDVDALEGYYQCRVSNTWGTVMSNQTLIRVAKEGTKRVYSHPFYYDANVGMQLTLPCKIEDHGYPLPTVDDISWIRDEEDMDQSQRLHFTDTGRSIHRSHSSSR